MCWKLLKIRIVRSTNQNPIRISSISYNLSPANICKCTGGTARAVLLKSAGVSFKGTQYSYVTIKQLSHFLKTGCIIYPMFARLEASSGLMAEGVPTNNLRGQRSEPCRLWGGLDKARHIVPTALLVRVQCFRKGLLKAAEGRYNNCWKNSTELIQ